MSKHKDWQAHGLKIWETGSDGLERVVADFAPEKYKACRLAASAPDLLEALEALEPHLLYEYQMLDEASLNDGRASDFGVASMKARAALKKAKP